MPDPISEVYQSMTRLGHEDGSDFDEWEKRIEIFHVTKHGGVALLHDPVEPGLWWVNLYCPNERPDNNTLRFLIALAFQSGCKVIRSMVHRKGAGRMFDRLGFAQIGDGLYEYRSC